MALLQTSAPARGSAPAAVGHRARTAAVAVVAGLAFLARLTVMLRGGGLSGSDGYDDSVYYAAATALVHGRLPYRDFVLLHPPGLILALTPFAGLAQLTSDRSGQDVARLAFMALGALNTVLVMRLAQRFGWVAGVSAGVVYALSYPALYAERTTTLEVLGNTGILVALVLLLDPVRRRTLGMPSRLWARTSHWPRGVLICAGLALGFGSTVKIWGVVALLVLAGWVLVAAGPRAAGWVTGPAAATVTAVCLPFWLAAPRAMWRMVVLDQLGRPRNGTSLTSRLETMVGLKALPHIPHLVVLAVLVLVLGLLGLATVVTARTPGAGVLVVLLLAHLAVLLAGPNLYLHYVSLVAAPGAVVLGVAAGRGWRLLRAHGRRTTAWLCLVAALLAVAGYGAPGVVRGKGKPLHADLAVAAARTPGCITADDPTYLIAMSVLSRNLRAGCPVWIDPTGIAIDQTRPGATTAYNAPDNPAWQHLVMTHLLSGDATMVARAATRLDPRSTDRIEGLPVIASAQGFTLRQVR